MGLLNKYVDKVANEALVESVGIANLFVMYAAWLAKEEALNEKG